MRQDDDIGKLFSDIDDIFNSKLLVDFAFAGPANHLIVEFIREVVQRIARGINDLLPCLASNIAGKVFVGVRKFDALDRSLIDYTGPVAAVDATYTAGAVGQKRRASAGADPLSSPTLTTRTACDWPPRRCSVPAMMTKQWQSPAPRSISPEPEASTTP